MAVSTDVNDLTVTFTTTLTIKRQKFDRQQITIRLRRFFHVDALALFAPRPSLKISYKTSSNKQLGIVKLSV